MSIEEDVLTTEYNKGYADGFANGLQAFWDAYKEKAYSMNMILAVADTSIISNIELCKILHDFGLPFSEDYLKSLSEEHQKYILGE